MYQSQDWDEKAVEIETTWSDLAESTVGSAKKSTKKTSKVLEKALHPDGR